MNFKVRKSNLAEIPCENFSMRIRSGIKYGCYMEKIQFSTCQKESLIMQIGIWNQLISTWIVFYGWNIEKFAENSLKASQKMEMKNHRKITIYTDVAGKIRRHVWFFFYSGERFFILMEGEKVKY